MVFGIGEAGDQAKGAGDKAQGAGDQAAGAGDKAQGAGNQAANAGNKAKHAGDQAQHAGNEAGRAADEVHQLNQKLEFLKPVNDILAKLDPLTKGLEDFEKTIASGGKGLEAMGPLASLEKLTSGVSDGGHGPGGSTNVATKGLEQIEAAAAKVTGGDFAKMLEGFKAHPDILPELPNKEVASLDPSKIFDQFAQTAGKAVETLTHSGPKAVPGMSDANGMGGISG